MMPSARVMVASLVSVSMLAAPAALGQDTPCEQRVRDLEESLRQAETRVRDLAKENERLRSENTGLRQAASGKEPAKGKADDAPADPLASPESLFQALVKDYESALAGHPRESKADLAKYHGLVRKWAGDASRSFRGNTEWQVKIVKVNAPAGAGNRPADVTFEVLDKAGKPAGKPVTMPIPGRFIKDLNEGAGQKVFKMTGTFGAKPGFNGDRADKGASDEPRFIGPFAEFAYDFAVQNITPVK